MVHVQEQDSHKHPRLQITAQLFHISKKKV